MRVESIQIAHISEYHFKSFNKIKSAKYEKERFIEGKELELTKVELLPFLFI